MALYTEEELAIAKSVDLVAVANALGYQTKRIGSYHTLKEMDSIRIYNHKTWYRWSRQYESEGRDGTQIDFLMTFGNYDFKEAVAWLLDFAGYRRMSEDAKKTLKHQAPKTVVKEKKAFALPVPARNNTYLYSYLINERGISKETVDKFVDKGLIYESRDYHNIIFKGLDAGGQCKFASMRGVFDDRGKPFKCDVEGNDKNYGFNIRNPESHEVLVFEGAIDLMSFADIHGDFELNMIALGMTADAPLETFLKDNPQIGSIKFCLDNDEAGRKATEALLKKYYELGYEVEDCPPPQTHKDFNDWLKAQRSITRDSCNKRAKVM